MNTTLSRTHAPAIYGPGTGLCRDASASPQAAGRTLAAEARHGGVSEACLTPPGKPLTSADTGGLRDMDHMRSTPQGQDPRPPRRIAATACAESEKNQKLAAFRQRRKPGRVCASSGLTGGTGWFGNARVSDRAIAEADASFGESAARLASLGNTDEESPR